MNVTDLSIDTQKTLGSPMLLLDIHPVFEYTDGKKSDTVIGYKYVICLPSRMYEKISVKILGVQKIEKPESGYREVEFTDLELYIYWMSGSYHIGARASDIIEVPTNK